MRNGGQFRSWKDNASPYKTRLGVYLFFTYAVAYFGFVGSHILAPEWLDVQVGPVNLAIAYGVFLIVLAIFQAILYHVLCTRAEKRLNV